VEHINFSFTIYKVQNLANGGYRVALDIPTIHAKEAAMLLVYADAPGVAGKAQVELEKSDSKEDEGWREA
jgi:hypothetical protein